MAANHWRLLVPRLLRLVTSTFITAVHQLKHIARRLTELLALLQGLAFGIVEVALKRPRNSSFADPRLGLPVRSKDSRGPVGSRPLSSKAIPPANCARPWFKVSCRLTASSEPLRSAAKTPVISVDPRSKVSCWSSAGGGPITCAAMAPVICVCNRIKRMVAEGDPHVANQGLVVANAGEPAQAAGGVAVQSTECAKLP